MVTSTGVWTLACGGGSCSNFTVTNNGQKLSGTTVTSGYIRATYTGLNASSKYRIKVTLTAGSNNNFAIQGVSADTGYVPATDGTAGTALQVGPSYVFEWSGSTQVQLTGSAWNTLYTFDDVSIKQIPNDGSPKVLPPYGIDEGVVVDGYTKINSPGVMYFPTGDTAQRSRGRMILFGGGEPGRTDNIDYLEMTSFGNSIDFGNLVAGNVWGSGATASSTRGVFWAAENQYTKLDYVTIATTGRAISFGTGNPSNSGTGFGNNTRGIWSLGGNNILEYVTIASTGNAQDFGDQTIMGGAATTAQTAFASSTRGVIAGGYGSNPYPQSNVIEYVTIATLGNGTNFGDLVTARSSVNGVSNSTRGVIAGGYTFPGSTTYYNIIEFVTIATTGDTTDFGDLTITKRACYNGSTPTRGVFAAGTPQTNAVNSIDYVTIATTGNAADFGDTRIAQRSGSGCSDSHGGLS